MEFLLGSIVLVGWIFGCAYAYKHRRRIAAWLNDPYMTTTGTTKREKVLRRKIEDCQEELDDIEAKQGE